MKKWISLAVLASLCLSLSMQSATFAAYGGGWSSVSSSSNFLSRDVCPSGDSSSSYYDGTCGSVEEEHLSTAEEKEEAVTNQEEISFVSTNDAEQWIVERKEVLEQAIETNEKKVLNMPLRYRMFQKQVDGIMNTWNDLDWQVRHKKSVKLIKKINVVLASKKLSPKLLTIVQYIQDKAVLMTSFDMLSVQTSSLDS